MLLSLAKWFEKKSKFYLLLANDHNKKTTSTYFGVVCLINVLLGYTINSFGIIFSLVMIKNNDNNPIIILLAIMLLIFFCILLLNFVIRSLACAFYQLRLNGKVVGYLALVISILALLFAIIIILSFAINR